MCRWQLLVCGLLLVLFALSSCTSVKPTIVRATISRYKSAPDAPEFHAIDTEEFWFNVDILYADSLLNGDRESFRLLLQLFADADGHKSECMPSLRHVVKLWPSMARRAIEESDVFSKKYHYLLRPGEESE